MAGMLLIVSADDATAAGGVAYDVLTLPADVRIRCSRIKCKNQVGLHNERDEPVCTVSSFRPNWTAFSLCTGTGEHRSIWMQ